MNDSGLIVTRIRRAAINVPTASDHGANSDSQGQRWRCPWLSHFAPLGLSCDFLVAHSPITKICTAVF
jgi:hypothetical protein